MWMSDEVIFFTFIVIVIGAVIWDMIRNGDWK